MRSKLLLIVVALLALSPVSCTISESGYSLLGANASTQDVVVTIGTSSGGSFLLKAKTWGTISTGVSKPTGDIVVSDLACVERARIRWTDPNSTVLIGIDGSVSIVEGRQTFPPDVQPVSRIDGGPLSSITPC
jgi:hypothetical protein